jgi:DNA-binding transcriptional ArsR family regulator
MKDLNPLALRIYALLNLLGCTVAHRRGYHRKASQVSYFCPAESICAHLEISRGSFYRSLKELLALGLVDARGHKTTINGWAVRCDGTLWSVKLLPHRGGRARLRYEDLKAQYRDLEADIEAGNTVWAQTRQSNTGEVNVVAFEFLLAWALPPVPAQNPVTLTVASDERLPLKILLDVPFVPKQGRREAVDKAARALSQHLTDATSLNFYRYLVWQLLRLHQQGRDHLLNVYQMVLRARADLIESFARRPGALFVSRLKACALWDELREVALTRVATT